MFAIQEIVVHVETSTLNELVHVINKITTVFSVFESEYLTARLIFEKKMQMEEEKSMDLYTYRKQEI